MILIKLFYLACRMVTVLLINCYTCPQTKTKTIQAHEIVSNEVKRSYSKMSHDNINLFSNYSNVLLVNVSKASELKRVNFIKF